MTPSVSTASTNSSNSHLPSGGKRNSAQPGGSSLLQEKLIERKKRFSIDLDTNVNYGGREVQSSPAKCARSEREERRPSSSGLSQPTKKAMGVKQMEETVSTLHKQNFDLKLELFHRRQKQGLLESELDKVKLQLQDQEKQLQDQAELQDVNDQLLSELEKRDRAVEEAVDLICELEAKNARLIKEREDVRSFDKQYDADADTDSDYFRHDHANLDIRSSPPTENVDFSRRKDVRRMPSFLSDKSENVGTLRSLYIDSHSESDVGLPRLLEEDGVSSNDAPSPMASPSLSILSESSFLSIYGEKVPENFETPSRHRNSAVEKWIDERPASTMPLHKPSSAVQNGPRNKFLSMNYVAASPLQRLEKVQTNLEQQRQTATSMRQASEPEKFSLHTQRTIGYRRATTGISAGHFESSQKFPPTPETISTGTLRNYRNSNDTLGHQHQTNDDDDDATFLHSTSTFSGPPTACNTYQSVISMRPRSAGDTVESRKHGHEGETEEQDDIDDSNSNYSAVSSNAPKSHLLPQQGQTRDRKAAPEFFSMKDRHSSARHWGGDMMFNDHPASNIPIATHTLGQRYEILRNTGHNQSPEAEKPHSDHTLTPGSGCRTQSRLDDRTSTSQENSPQPSALSRRSSLAARLRKQVPGISINTNTNNIAFASPSSPVSPKEEKEKPHKYFPRLRPPRLFGTRTDTAPVPTRAANPNPPSTLIQRARTVISDKERFRGQHEADVKLMNVDEDLYKMTGATPPPILRSRMGGAQSQLGYRPMSAGVVEHGQRHRGGSLRERGGGRYGGSYAFGGDGACDDYESDDEFQGECEGARKSLDGGFGTEGENNVHADGKENGNKGPCAKGRKWLGSFTKK